MQYATLKEKIAAEKANRLERHSHYLTVFDKALAEGLLAGQNHNPRAMKITDSFTGQTWVEESGMCGFAWVVVKGANKGFGHWLLKSGRARKSYYGGAEIWVSEFGQSYERKAAMASAMAQVFNDAGFDSYAGSRLD
jgi:rhamnogalacturonyl hydrolase YesR